nr:uncharacterized protein LOC129384934 isoform X2 [Dermacentor andersoni]
MDDNGSKVSFFCFPRDPHLKKKWIVAIKRDEGKLFVVTKHTKVCSNHFTTDSYLPNVVGDRRFLRVDAVPSVFAFGKPKPPARKKPKQRQQCVAKMKLLSAVGQASSSGFASQPPLSPSSDVAASRDSSTAVETMDATECASVSNPASATHVRDHEVCDCACAVRVLELEKQLSLLQMRIHQLENDLEGRTEEVRSAKANAERVPELETQLSLLQVGQMDLWLSRDKVDKAMPAIFKERYPSTRAIIDATEVRCEVPSSLVLQSATYSTYKSTNTMKGLVVISPDGTITFLSKLFTGSVSDKELVEKSGFLKLEFEPGDSVMADKGFKIQDLLSAKGVALNIPPFLRRQHLTEEEVRQTEEIASLRIHVERRIQRIKAFHIFDRPIPLSIAPIINEIWALCAFLSNLQSPLTAT